MSVRTLHERVAGVMALSESVGPYSSYEVILARLRSHFPSEEALRAHIETLEGDAKAAGLVMDDWSFIPDE